MRNKRKDKEERCIMDCPAGKRTMVPEIYDSLHQNPTVRDLPKYAEMFGLYSSFFVSDEHIYFIYGYDWHMIHEEPFIEAHNWIYPECELEKYGYSQRVSLLGRSWNVGIIDGDMVDYTYIINRMASLEMLNDRYKLHGLKMPRFMFFPNDYIERFRTFIAMVDNRKTKGTLLRNTYWNQEEEVLKGIAIPEWPICPQNEKPGILAFIGISGCIPDKFSKVKHDYEHPSTWRKNFEKYCETCYVYADIDPNEAEFILKKLDEHGYMYKISSTDKKADEEDANERKMYARIMSESMKTDVPPKMPGITFSVYNPAIDYVSYLFDVLRVKEHEKSNELENGRKMMADLMGEMDEQEEPAYFIFGLPDYMRKPFSEFAAKMNIEYGYPDEYYRNKKTTSGSYFITPICNMPAVEAYLQEQYNTKFSEHRVSSAHNAAGEIRTREINGIGCSVLSFPWELLDTNLKAADIATGKIYNMSGKDLLGAAVSYNIGIMEDAGHYVDNTQKP